MDCPNRGIEVEDCTGHHQDAGVVCLPGNLFRVELFKSSLILISEGDTNDIICSHFSCSRT